MRLIQDVFGHNKYNTCLEITCGITLSRFYYLYPFGQLSDKYFESTGKAAEYNMINTFITYTKPNL